MNKIYDDTVYQNTKVLWDYLVLNQPLEKTDCILVFGGHDPSVAIHAANLFKQGWSSSIIVSGGVTHPAHYYGNEKDAVEAEALTEVLLREGIPESVIYKECAAKNTSENFWFTRDLLEAKKLSYRSFILVQKPYTERRTFLTGQNRWPDMNIIISSIPVSFDEYLSGAIEQKKIIDMITGEIYRISKYPELGYFKRQDIPEKVWDAYLWLKDHGFSSRI